MSLETISYENSIDINGGHGATRICQCDVSEWKSQRDTLLRSIDGNDSDLICTSIRCAPKGDVMAPVKYTLTMQYGPKNLQKPQAGDPFIWRHDVSCEAFTISGKGTVKWISGQEIKNTNILPYKRIPVVKITGSGVKESWDLASVAGYIGKVNSDSFLGAAIETVYFDSFSSSPRTDENGDTVYDVEYSMLYRPTVTWQKFFNETTGNWEEIILGASKAYETTSFAGLLT